MLGQFVVFDKHIANELIKRGFPLREIGGNIHNVYYFDDVAALHDAIEDIKKEPYQGFKVRLTDILL